MSIYRSLFIVWFSLTCFLGILAPLPAGFWV